MLYAALKAPLFHGAARLSVDPSRALLRLTARIKGNGQCGPFGTGIGRFYAHLLHRILVGCSLRQGRPLSRGFRELVPSGQNWTVWTEIVLPHLQP